MGCVIMASSDEKSEGRGSKYLAQGHMVVSGRAQKTTQTVGLWSTREPCPVRAGEYE